MTDEERDPAAAEADADELPADEAVDDEVDEDELIDDESVEQDDRSATIAPASAVAADAARRGRKGQAARTQAAAPSVSDQAVHINDRASAIFVIALVGMFVAVFVAAMLVGPGGLFGNVLKGPTPTPAVESLAPESASPSASASESPSAGASESPSAG